MNEELTLGSSNITYNLDAMEFTIRLPNSSDSIIIPYDILESIKNDTKHKAEAKDYFENLALIKICIHDFKGNFSGHPRTLDGYTCSKCKTWQKYI